MYSPDSGNTDRDLVKKVLEGNNFAFRIIINNNQRLVINIISKLVINAEDQKDLLQEVFIKVYTALEKFAYQSKLSTWIGSIAYNHCLNFLEKKKHLNLNDYLGISSLCPEDNDEALAIFTDNALLPDRLLEKTILKEILAREIANLPKLYQTIITLYHSEEESYGEIAVIMSIPAGTVKTYLFRARKLLQKNLLLKYSKEELW